MYTDVKTVEQKKDYEVCSYGNCIEDATDKWKEFPLCHPHLIYMEQDYGDEDSLEVVKNSRS